MRHADERETNGIDRMVAWMYHYAEKEGKLFSFQQMRAGQLIKISSLADCRPIDQVDLEDAAADENGGAELLWEIQ